MNRFNIILDLSTLYSFFLLLLLNFPTVELIKLLLFFYNYSNQIRLLNRQLGWGDVI